MSDAGSVDDDVTFQLSASYVGACSPGSVMRVYYSRHCAACRLNSFLGSPILFYHPTDWQADSRLQPAHGRSDVKNRLQIDVRQLCNGGHYSRRQQQHQSMRRCVYEVRAVLLLLLMMYLILLSLTELIAKRLDSGWIACRSSALLSRCYR